HVVTRDAALTDARALADPLVGRLDHRLGVRVRQDASRQVPTGRYDLYDGLGCLHPVFLSIRSRTHSCAAPACAVTSCAMCRTTFVCTAWRATRIAFAIARGGEPPWQMIETPFTPRSGAPPSSV